MKRKTGSTGFTLTEMLVTLAIMVLVVSLAIPLVSSARASARRSDAVNAVRAALASARQAAVERRTVVAVEFVRDTTSANRGDTMVLVDKSVDVTGDRRIGQPVQLGDFIKFDSSIATEWTLANGWDGDPDDVNDLYFLTTGDPDPAKRYPDIAYTADGTAADVEGTTDLAIVDTVDNLRIVLRVLPSTGLVVEAWHLQDPLQAESATNPSEKGWL